MNNTVTGEEKLYRTTNSSPHMIVYYVVLEIQCIASQADEYVINTNKLRDIVMVGIRVRVKP